MEIDYEKFTYKLDELKNIPQSPGVYFMKDKDNRLLYIGKSKNLNKRIKSYFLNSRDRSNKIEIMIKNISHIEIIKTDTEFDALFLECKNIHKLKPMYNTLLKNYDKYKYICLDEKDHNIIKISNEIEEDGVYFGPYSFKRKLDIIKEIIIKVYRLPICKRQNKCIRYDLNKCIGVCRGNIENDKRLDIVENIKDNLNGKSNFVIESLKKEMNEKAKDLGMNNTHFMNATGLHNESHYTTVKDIGILLQYALKNQTFNDIFQSKSYFVAPTDQHLSGFTFYSSMFKLRDQWELDEGEIVGGKTGYTDEAGLCLASEAIVNGRKYIAITVNAEGNHNTEPFHVNDAFYLYNQLQSQ